MRKLPLSWLSWLRSVGGSAPTSMLKDCPRVCVGVVEVRASSQRLEYKRNCVFASRVFVVEARSPRRSHALICCLDETPAACFFSFFPFLSCLCLSCAFSSNSWAVPRTFLGTVARVLAHNIFDTPCAQTQHRIDAGKRPSRYSKANSANYTFLHLLTARLLFVVFVLNSRW